ncbi:MAG: hypothetical protein ABJH04_10650 [Cyclobacteriaceae bacterium]
MREERPKNHTVDSSLPLREAVTIRSSGKKIPDHTRWSGTYKTLKNWLHSQLVQPFQERMLSVSIHRSKSSFNFINTLNCHEAQINCSTLHTCGI